MNAKCRRITLLMLALLMAIAPAALADEQAETDYPGMEREVWLDDLNEKYARQLPQAQQAMYRYAAVQGSILADLIEMKGFTSIAANQYPDMEKLLAEVELKRPTRMELYYCPSDKLDLLHVFGGYADEVPEWFAEDARSVMYKLPFDGLSSLTKGWDEFSQSIALNEAASIADMDGLGYVCQYWEEDEVFLMTAIYTYDYPHVITHTRVMPPDEAGNVPIILAQFFDVEQSEFSRIG